MQQKIFALAFEHCLQNSPGPRLMRVHLVRNSNSAKFEKSLNIHLVRPKNTVFLVRPIIHLVRILALSDWYELVE